MMQEYIEKTDGIRHIFYQKFLTDAGNIEATFEINLPFSFFFLKVLSYWNLNRR